MGEFAFAAGYDRGSDLIDRNENFMADNDSVNDEPAHATALGGWRWFVVYAVLAMIIEWPVVGSLTTHISYGHENEITVPLLNLWTVWWNADRATHWFWGYFDAPIFYPTKKTFLFSEAQPTSLIVAPLIWLTGNRGLAYNVYQLLILALNGFSAHRLLRRLGHIGWLAFCGGVMSQILPFAMWQLGAIQLTTLFGIYWTLHAVLDLFGTANAPVPSDDAISATEGPDQPSRGLDPWDNGPVRRQFVFPVGVRLGFAYGITYWLCNYWGLFLTLLVVPSSVWFWNRRLVFRSFWLQLLWAFMITAVMIGPIALSQRSLARDHDWISARTPDMVQDLSAHWRDYTDVPWRNLAPWLEFPDPARANVWTLGGGGLKLWLAPIGLIAAFGSRQRRRWGAFAATFGAIAFGLSLGPTIRFVDSVPVVGGICPYERLQQFIPGLTLIRSPFRFSLFVQLACVWLAIEALDLLNPARWTNRPIEESEDQTGWLQQRLHQLFGSAQTSAPFAVILLPLFLVTALVTLEAVPPKTRLYELPSRDGLPVWVQWLRDNAKPDTAIACLPFPTGNNVLDYEETTVWMYWSTFHKRALVNGYSGFFPLNYRDVYDGLLQFQRPADLGPDKVSAPKFADYSSDNPGLKRLNESSVRYVAVKRSFGTRNDIWMQPATRFRWALVVSDETAQVDVYQLPVWDE